MVNHESCHHDYYLEYRRTKYIEMLGRLTAKLEDEDPEIRTEQDISRLTEVLRSENLLLLGGIIVGYSLRNRKWGQ